MPNCICQAPHNSARLLHNRLTLAAFLGTDAAKRARSIDQAQNRSTKLFGLAHQATRFAVALGMCHTKVATHALFGRGAALDGDDRYGASVFPANTGHHSGVVSKVTVAVQLHKSIQAQ